MRAGLLAEGQGGAKATGVGSLVRRGAWVVPMRQFCCQRARCLRPPPLAPFALLLHMAVPPAAAPPQEVRRQPVPGDVRPHCSLQQAGRGRQGGPRARGWQGRPRAGRARPRQGPALIPSWPSTQGWWWVGDYHFRRGARQGGSKPHTIDKRAVGFSDCRRWTGLRLLLLRPSNHADVLFWRPLIIPSSAVLVAIVAAMRHKD